jgi:hypothetical protein
MGPDNSGRAIRRMFTRRGFAAKMLKSNAVRLYGLRTALYGTLLPAPQIARSFPERAVTRELDAALAVFREIVGGEPAGFAAPGWQCGAASLAAIERGPFLYHSSTRGSHPYRPRAGRISGRLPEIPTTLPTIDELLGQGIRGDELLDRCLPRIGAVGLEILTVHAEVEGGRYVDLFDRLLERLNGRVRFRRLVDVARGLDAHALPLCDVVQATRAGRAGTVSCQAA